MDADDEEEVVLAFDEFSESVDDVREDVDEYEEHEDDVGVDELIM